MVYTRHHHFYFNESDTYVFRTGNTLFRVHGWVLRRYCDYFRDNLSTLTSTRGSSDSNPVVVASLQLGNGESKDMTALRFELAMRVLYTESFFDNPPNTSDDWLKVLEVSAGWASSHLRHAAITRLGLFTLPLLIRLQYALQYHIDDWLKDIYRDLCLQRKPVSSEIIRLLHSEDTIANFFVTREAVRNEFLQVYQGYRAGCGVHGSPTGGLTPVLIRSLEGSAASGEYATILDAFDAFFHDGSHCNRAGNQSPTYKAIMQEHAARLVLEHMFPAIFPPTITLD